MSLSEKVQQINREIGATVERALADVRREVSQRLRESAEALQERISQIAPSLPGAFVAHDDLAPFATRAERRARRFAAAEIRDALSAVDAARSQAEILGALLRETGRWSSRSAVLLLRGGEVRGWGSLGFGDADGGAIREVSLGAPDGGAWGQVFQGQSGARLSASDCAALCNRLEAPLPKGGVLLPLVLRDRVAAVLYADRTDGEALSVESLQILIYTAALAIESLAFRERAATATLQPIEGEEEEAALAEATAPAPDAIADAETAPEAMAASAAQREAEAAPETGDVETAESLTPEPLHAVAAEPEVPEVPEVAIEPEPEPEPAPAEIEAAGDQEESAWQAPAPLAPYDPYAETATAELSAVPELETEPGLDASLDAEVEIEAEPDYSAIASGGASGGASVGYTEPAVEEPVATDAPWNSSVELEAPVETSYGATLDDAPAPAWAAPAEPAQEEATSPTQQIDLGSLPPSSYEPQPPAGSAEATVLLNRASLREAASPYAPYTVPERVEPAEPVREEPAPPPPTPIRPVPPPTTEVAPPPAAAESGSLAGTPEVRPPSDVQGPGWAFANSRAAAAQPVDDALHEEARRLARLLVSEIKLYNEEQVEEGRRRRDVYERLKEDIDRSRQMYEERVEPRILKSTDYFYQELVRILAAGDAKALGI